MPGKHELTAQLLAFLYSDISGFSNISHKELGGFAKALLAIGAIIIIPVFIWSFPLFMLFCLVIISLVAAFYRVNRPRLTLTLKDELGMNQTVVFRMKKPEESFRGIYDAIVKAKKKQFEK